ncbi:MAG: BatC protein [Flavobacterium sp. BFFFF1]|uniref:tetratricopeptide repeat protein n=1 Tax=unclassified Flavobacterium TaxID=196869 RepID=UPI000BC561C6|nr:MULTISPECIES: tetratricopeptide repeat protein [unclassified Flavobacterium]OYU80923.1 MAG: BatC protein [Flavobacterium sp. BFFFF1]
MKRLFIYTLIFISFAVKSQEKDFSLPKGNEKIKEKKYADAEAEYRVSQSKFPKKAAATYNLGNAIFLQNQAEEAALFYQRAIKNAKTHDEKHKAYHNLGNVHMKQKNYEAAVEDYKNALINNPADEHTRYNYALAKDMLKKNPPKKDDKKNKDKKKDQDKKDQDKKDQDKKDQDKKDQDKKDQNKEDQNKDGKDKPDPNKNQGQQGQPKPKPGGISKERLQNLLDAVNNEEKKVQEKVNAKKVKGKPVQTEKDW